MVTVARIDRRACLARLGWGGVASRSGSGRHSPGPGSSSAALAAGGGSRRHHLRGALQELRAPGYQFADPVVALTGRPVQIAGYMAPPLKAESDFFA